MQRQENIESPQHDPNLDGLRALASLMVLTFHLFVFVDGPKYFPDSNIYFERLSRGVQLFFVLSAFTLFQSARSRWETSNHPVLAFYVRRAFRILPLWWIAIAIEYFRLPEIDLKSSIGSAFFIFGLKQEWFILLVIPVGWSLFVEETFYVLFPVWRVILRKIIPSLVVAVLAYVGTHYILQNNFWGLIQISNHDFLSRSPLTNYYAFFIGILLERMRSAGLFEWVSSNQTAPKVFLNVLTLYCVLLVFAFGRLEGTLVVALLLIISFNPRTLFGALMNTRLMTTMGKCCYSIYLFHGNIGYYFASNAKVYFWPALGLNEMPREAKLLVLLPFVTLTCLAVGLLSHRLIEQPSISLGKYFVTKLGAKNSAQAELNAREFVPTR